VSGIQRRLPVYFLVDCSESMIGSAIEAVQEGLGALINSLRSDPHALETVHVSFITFAHEAREIIPLTELPIVQPPNLFVSPGTSLGAGLRLLNKSILRDVRKSTVNQKGDYRPLVFLITDGQPTDDIQEAIAELNNSTTGVRVANIYAIGCGDDVDFDLLRKISDIVYKVEDLNPDNVKKMFVWLSSSVKSASVSVAANEGLLDKLSKDKLPDDMRELAPDECCKLEGPPRQAFIKAYCCQEMKPYLMRFRFDETHKCYNPTAAHELHIEMGEGGRPVPFEMPALNSSSLNGCPPCPFCGSLVAGVCSCGSVFCMPVEGLDCVVCPACKQTVNMSREGGDFNVSQSAG
jgi:uncharacterized protein YegL